MGIPQIPSRLTAPRRPRRHRWGLGLLLTVLAALVAVPPAASDEQVPIPPIAALEEGAYRVRDSHTGQELWEEEWLLHRESRAGHFILHLQENGKGLRERTAPTVWTDSVRLDLWGPHPALTAIRETRDADGRPMSVDQREFDYELGVGQLVSRDATTGDADVRSVSLTRRAIPTEVLPAILRLLPEMAAHQMFFDLVTDAGRLIGMHATVVGREWVTVPAGRFECFKIALEPTGAAGLLLAVMRAKLYMWHTVAAPHFWVKYQGPQDGATSRQIVQELVRFDAREVSAPAPGRALAAAGPAGVIAALHAPGPPRGSRIPMPASIWYVVLLAAVVFEIGVEATHFLAD
jgi:hypothetical protein